MKNKRSINLDCCEFNFQELSHNEQQLTNGGSGLTRALGWIIGGIIGYASWMGVEG